ncbi:MAG: RNA 2',3'-cyclic phosphodiesterase [Methylacidiphilales bacterium]|nr:RNA 2',3'-cyclic phosphodiesterase [Candidatus Methylacidiphilales bacterium]
MAKRIFIGLELPEGSRTLLTGLDPHIPGVRWTPAAQMHLTISFLGAVEPEREEILRTVLAGIRVAPFFLPLSGVGMFGGKGPTILCAGVGNGHPHLFALHKRIQDAVFQAGFEPDLKPFHPHVTLGRIKDVPRHALRPFLQKYDQAEFDLWRVSGFVLFSSVLSREGAIHYVEGRFEF